jgi:drug/metabolite transporter (DMT)-like permease
MRKIPRNQIVLRSVTGPPDASTETPKATWAVQAAVLVVIVLWASAFIAIRSAAHSFTPGPLAFIRLIIGSAALTVVASRTRPSLPRGRSALLILIYGLAWFGAYNVLLNTAERHLDAGTSAMLVNVAPLLVALAAGTLLGEGYPRRLIGGLVVGFIGVCVIALGDSGRHHDRLGIVLALAAALCYAVGVLSQKVLLRSHTALQVTWFGCLIGAIATAPFAPQAIHQLIDARLQDTLLALYLGIFPTATGFLLWAFALRRTAAGKLVATTLAVPAIAVLLSWLFLSELPTPTALIGGAICIVGVGVAVVGSKRVRDHQISVTTTQSKTTGGTTGSGEMNL